ncbi:MAG: hypothetical protein JST68_26960 [Bacteroidetes bacterium]|nr:hypothetical protein [Bacteroidota bacterium]
MLQNRVDPYGHLIKTPARGAWTGNRGVIHNEDKEIVRPFKLKAWITCLLEYKGKKRPIMAPNRWTELFFLDEATAFSAGHRPCAFCRYPDHKRFKTAWLKGNPQYGFNEKTPISKIDDILHKERINKDRTKPTYEENLNHLPSGAFVIYNNQPHLLYEKKLYPWTPAGYEPGIPLPKETKLPVLTPQSIINTFKAGYTPQIKIS